jgi:acyl-CoA thioesterase-1
MRFLSLILSLWLPVAGAAPSPATTASSFASPPNLLVWGDSLSAAYGIDASTGWVALLQQRLQAEGYGYRVVNASVSGETTTGGLSRLPRALQLHRPQVFVLELGGNDGLRGLPLATSRKNLERMIQLVQAKGAKVLLLGIKIPPNYGARYANGFEQTYLDLAKKYQVPLIPFFLDGVALNPQLMQRDGLHPRAEAQPILLKNVWPALQPLLRKR